MLIGLIPQHVQRMRPPRALNVPFELGRPLGSPDNAEFQHKVLAAAFALLTQPGPGPIVDDFAQDAPDAPTNNEETQAWACPVSFSDNTTDSPEQGLLNEIASLNPWFLRARQNRGHTATGTSELEMADIVRLLLAVNEGEAVQTDTSVIAFGDRFKLAAEDLKMFYAEAAMEQPNPGSSKDIQDWFWNNTRAGALLFDLVESGAKHPDKLVQNHAKFTLVPRMRLLAR